MRSRPPAGALAGAFDGALDGAFAANAPLRHTRPMTSARPKTHREFFRIAFDAAAAGTAGWTPVPGSEGLITELILADNTDPVGKTGSRTRLARWQPGARVSEAVIHDFHEEVFIVEGDLVVGCDAGGEGGERFDAYTFACRPPQVLHGPFISRSGCMLLEFQYYD